MKAGTTQKPSEEVESGTGLGPDLTASIETTYSEQSSSSAGSSSSSDQPIYFRYIEKLYLHHDCNRPRILYNLVSWYALSLGQEHFGFCVFTPIREFRFTSEVPIWLDYHGKHVAIEQVRVQALDDEHH